MYWFDSGKYSHTVLPSEISIERSSVPDVSPSRFTGREQQTSMRTGARGREVGIGLVGVIELKLRRGQLSIRFTDFPQQAPPLRRCSSFGSGFCRSNSTV